MKQMTDFRRIGLQIRGLMSFGFVIRNDEARPLRASRLQLKQAVAVAKGTHHLLIVRLKIFWASRASYLSQRAPRALPKKLRVFVSLCLILLSEHREPYVFPSEHREPFPKTLCLCVFAFNSP